MEKSKQMDSQATEAAPTITEDSKECIQRDELTSEIYEIEVRNLGYFGKREFKKLIKNKLKLDMSKLKSPKRKDQAFISFRTKEVQEKTIQLLNGYKFKGKVLQAFDAKASADPQQRKRKEIESSAKSTDNRKKPKNSAEANCPLASMPYEEQLKQKNDSMEELLKKFTHGLKKTNKASSNALDSFKYEGMLASPQIDGYRNKNAFRIGKNSQGEIVVGFRLGSNADGSVEVDEVEALPDIPKATKWAAITFQQFVRQSKFEAFNPKVNSGHFRQLMVRYSEKTKELMLVAGIYSSNLNEDELKQIKQDLKQYYETLNANETNEFQCTSLYYQDVKQHEAGQMVSTVEHLLGTTHIRDFIQELEFHISPFGFFQSNTASANVLYEKAIELAAAQKHSTVLDICCGTGSIALAFAKHCKQVFGVEIIADAIKDAEYNAELNKIANCKFYVGNADDYIQSMVKEAMYGTEPDEQLDLIAVVDPPRPGLHNKTIAAIRSATAIKRLVYISCNPPRARRNWIELGRTVSKQYKGAPFYPKVAVAVDMLPHTQQTEMIVLFERETTYETAEEKEETKSEKDLETNPTEETSVENTINKSPNNVEFSKKANEVIAVDSSKETEVIE